MGIWWPAAQLQGGRLVREPRGACERVCEGGGAFSGTRHGSGQRAASDGVRRATVRPGPGSNTERRHVRRGCGFVVQGGAEAEESWALKRKQMHYAYGTISGQGLALGGLYVPPTKEKP